MARYVGVDIGATQVKVAVLRGAVRKLQVERLVSIDRFDRVALDRSVGMAVGRVDGAEAPTQTLEEIVAEAAGESARDGDPLAVGFDGSRLYVRSLEVPAAVRRRVAEVLPFELEAQLPFDIDDAVFDFRARPGVPSALPQPVLVTAARTDDVRERIDLVKRALGREPDHVGPSAFPLADLAAALPPFRMPGVRAILDLGFEESELLIVDGSEPVSARTLSRGVEGMPASAAHLAREIRQSFSAWRSSGGEAPVEVFLTGGGALVPELPRWLSAELQIGIEPLPLGVLEGLSPDRPRTEPNDKRAEAHRFARALGLAYGCAPRRRGLDLRRGPLTYERGYGFLREKVPLLAGLGGATLVFFLFSTWARARTLSADRKVLTDALADTTKEVFGEKTTDPDRAQELLGAKGPQGSSDDDPLPRADAMDVLVQISELIPTDKMKHDIEKLEVAKQSTGGFRVVLQGVAPTGADVSTIEASFKAYRCFQNPLVTKKSKAIADDRQKYTLEVELRCPEEGGGAKKPASSGGGSAGSAGGK